MKSEDDILPFPLICSYSMAEWVGLQDWTVLSVTPLTLNSIQMMTKGPMQLATSFPPWARALVQADTTEQKCTEQ